MLIVKTIGLYLILEKLRAMESLTFLDKQMPNNVLFFMTQATFIIYHLATQNDLHA